VLRVMFEHGPADGDYRYYFGLRPDSEEFANLFRTIGDWTPSSSR